jgi:NADH dehydrogenase FAD-containing subunit
MKLRQRVIVVGGGFGGISAVKALAKSHALDRSNHHLTYQRGSRLITGHRLDAGVPERSPIQSEVREVERTSGSRAL